MSTKTIDFSGILKTLLDHYQEKYGIPLEKSDNLFYLVSDYYATGEGRTVSILITSGDYDDTEYSHLREFYDLFGPYYFLSLEFITKDELLTQYKSCVPELVPKLIGSGYCNFYSQIHFNGS